MLKDIALRTSEKEVSFYAGKGCKACKETGYRGRTGIIELLVMNEEIKELVIAKASSSAIKKAAETAGLKTMRENGLAKVLQGITTIDEILQATRTE